MGINTDKIRGRMSELHITQGQMVQELKAKGVPASRAAFNGKMCGRTEFKVNEFLAVMQVLGVEDFTEYVIE